jgi:hypothetical protein
MFPARWFAQQATVGGVAGGMIAGEATTHLAFHRTLSCQIGNYQRGVNRDNQRVTRILFRDKAADFLIGVDQLRRLDFSQPIFPPFEHRQPRRVARPPRKVNTYPQCRCSVHLEDSIRVRNLPVR